MAIRRAAERPRDSHVDHRFFSGFKVGSSKCANGVAVKVKLPTNHVREVRCRADPGHQTGAPKTGKRNHAAVTEVSNTIRKIESVYIKDSKVHVKDGKIISYGVICKVSFRVGED